MDYNQKTLASLDDTWIGELLSISQEEIETVNNELLYAGTKVGIINNNEPKEVTFPLFFGEMNDFEKAVSTLLYKKITQYHEMCIPEIVVELRLSSEYEKLNYLINYLEKVVLDSIKKRHSDTRVGLILISKGGKIFCNPERKTIVDGIFREILFCWL